MIVYKKELKLSKLYALPPPLPPLPSAHLLSQTPSGPRGESCKRTMDHCTISLCFMISLWGIIFEETIYISSSEEWNSSDFDIIKQVSSAAYYRGW